MKHLFVPYKLALKLKEKGFDEPCIATIDFNRNDDGWVEVFRIKDRYDGKSNYDLPLYQQVIDWFREKHNLHFEIKVEDYVSEPTYYWSIFGKYKDMLYIRCLMNSGDKFTQDKFKSYYETLDKAIEEALELI